jgi:hypothetical protein
MSAHTVSHSGFGPLNRDFPVFARGGLFFWDSRFGASYGMHPGGVQVAGSGLAYFYAGTDLVTVWDHGRGRYVEYDPTAVDVIPTDGQFSPDRSSYYNASRPATDAGRGPFTAQAGLTVDTLPTVDNHILLTATGVPATVPRITNTTGAARRLYRLESTSGAFRRIWSVLLRRVDGGVIDASVASLGTSAAADPLGVNLSDATIYQRLRSDGWYRLYCTQPISGANVYYYLQIENGTDVVLECPQTESVGVSITEPSQPLLTDADPDSPNRPVFSLNFFDSLAVDLPQAGWIAAAFTPRKDAVPAGTVYPSSVIVRLASAAAPANDYHQIYISSTQQEIAYQCAIGGVSQCFLNSTTAEILQGGPIGFVGTWGYRAGSIQFVASQNGLITEIDTTGALPVGACLLSIGGDSAGASPSNVNIWCVAIGNRMLDRAESAYLSRWLRNVASSRTYMGLTGT